MGIFGLVGAAVCVVAVMFTREQILTVILLSLAYGGITFQQSGVFGVCLDIGRKNAGAVTGLMNTSAQIGGLVGSVAYGYIVDKFGSYDAPFIPMAAVLSLGAFLWFKIDASEELIPSKIGSEPRPSAKTTGTT